MGFWFFMLAMVLLIPIVMIAFGVVSMTKPPEKINYIYGYRTHRSMINKDTWDYAHRFFGRLWFIVGLIILPLSVVPMFFMLGKDTDSVGTIGGIIVVLQLIPLILPVIPTEISLSKKFDRDGNRRQEQK